MTRVTAPRQVVVSDIPCLRLTHTFVYRFLVTDLYSRKIVGWHVSRDLSHHAAVNAVAMTTCSSSPPCACCRV